MSNNINSQLANNTNNLAVKTQDMSFAAKVKSRYVEAPQSLPKFSITQSLNERDEFRKNVIQTNYKTKQRKNSFTKFLTIAIVGLATAFSYKKLIK